MLGLATGTYKVAGLGFTFNYSDKVSLQGVGSSQSSMAYKMRRSLIRLISSSTNQTDDKESSNHPEVFPDPVAPEVEVNNETVLNVLKKILSEQSNHEDFETAAEVVKSWKLKGITLDSFPQELHLELFQAVNQFVESHFPVGDFMADGIQHQEGSQVQEFLRSAESMISDEVLRLTPVLKDVGLLDHLIDSYSRLLFNTLDRILKQDLSVNESFYLLLWGKDVFFRPDSQHVFRVSDPLLLTGWFERATKKLLPKLQNEISWTLKNILHLQQQGHLTETMDEETFLAVPLDVSQCLNAVVQNAKKCSKRLMCMTQKICLEELHHFVQTYVKEKQKHLNTNSAQDLFRVISTCRQLKFLAPQLNNPDINKSDDLLNINCMLKKMEDKALSVVHKMMKDLSQDHLRKHFKNDDKDICILKDAIQKHCASLPHTDMGKEIRKIFVNVAYDCVSHAYLDCLMKSKWKHLENRWEDVGIRMREDNLDFHKTFTELNDSDDQKNQLLQRMSEVLCCSDVDALKLVCAQLFKDFPNDSQKYVPGLLLWKGDLSKQQVREILKVRDLDLDPSPRHVTCHPLKGLYCFH